MLKAGEFAPLFANVATVYSMNRMWWQKHLVTFQKWWEVIDDEYAPLWDKDEYEQINEETRDQGSSSSRTAGNGQSSNDGKTSSIAHDEYKDETKDKSKAYTSDHLTTDQSKGEVENGVSAFDSSAYSPHDKSESRDAHTKNENGYSDAANQGEVVHNGANTAGTAQLGNATSTNEGTSDTVHESEGNRQHVLHHWGNAGISTTAQKLMEQELRVRAYNLYEMMADIFVDEMCVRVYL